MSYSLVHPIKDKGGVEMHHLVQDVIRDAARSEQVSWFMTSAEMVDSRFPWGGDSNNLKSCTNYLSQAQTCVGHALELQILSPIVTRLLESTAGYFDITGQYGEALVSYAQALEIRNHIFGVDHLDSVGTIIGIGNVYHSQRRYEEAIATVRKGVEDR